MPSSLVLRIELDLAETGRGGRRRPLTDGYRASMSFGRWRRDAELVVHDAILVLEGRDHLAPGARGIARAWVIVPDELPRDLETGRVFTLIEGERIIARATLLELLVDETEGPLSDLRSAKTRPLAPADA